MDGWVGETRDLQGDNFDGKWNSIKKLTGNKNQLSSKYLLLNNPKFLNVCLLKQRRRLQLTFFQSKE